MSYGEAYGADRSLYGKLRRKTARMINRRPLTQAPGEGSPLYEHYGTCAVIQPRKASLTGFSCLPSGTTR